jgi:hypothetical protein
MKVVGAGAAVGLDALRQLEGLHARARNAAE